MLSGTWATLTNPSPAGSGTMLLLSDGTVLSQANDYSSGWLRLTPDAKGSYANGTWSSAASMNNAREFFASNLLKDGRLFVEGGEYSGTGSDTNTGEIYDPVANTWKMIPNFPQSNFGDDPSQLLPDGRVLAGYLSGPQTYIYDPAQNSWSAAATKLRNDRSDEETWLKLPDDSILTYEIFTQGQSTAHAQRYIPATNTWVDAGTVPVLLSSAADGYELGPAFLLPDGRAFFIGANGHTAYYSPQTNTWTAGPDVPNGLGADDEPGAMMPNGKILFAAETPYWKPPSRVFEYDPVAQTYTDVTPQGYDLSFKGFHNRMLVLPSGQVLFNNGTNQLEVYTPSGAPSAAWKPAISDIVDDGGGKFTLTGIQINGISQGASFGDDAEMDSNYPIVRLSDFSGHVYYARTSNWSSTGVATGSTPETVDFTLPAAAAPGIYCVQVIANGIASDAALAVFGSAGNDTVTVDAPSPGSGFVSMGATNVNFALNTVTGIYVLCGAGNDTVNVLGTAAGQKLTIDGGAGNDAFNISGQTHNLDSIHGNVVIRGGSGTNGMTVYDQSKAAAVAYTVNSSGSVSVIGRTGAAAISSDAAVSTVNLYGGSATDSYDVESLPKPVTLYVNGGPKSDKFAIAQSAQTLDGLQGSLSIVGGGGGDSLTINDQSAAAPVTYTMGTSGSLSGFTRTGAALLSFDNSVTAVTLNGGSGADTYSISGTQAGTSVKINGGNGANTLAGPASDSVWDLMGTNSGTLQSAPLLSSVNFYGMPNLKGGAGADKFRVHNQANFTGTVDGGGGSNTIDNSSYVGGVVDDLLTKSATGIQTVVNVTNVIGSNGSDVIVGSGAPGTLKGGTGRNLIIAEQGTGTLIGGGDQDILIAGTTPYDGNVTALSKILAEWNQLTPLSTRKSNIMGGGGVNGLYILTPGPGGVLWNNQVNTLTDGTGLDWVFLRMGTDKRQNAKAGDIVTPI
jgi:hypothetical protein